MVSFAISCAFSDENLYRFDRRITLAVRNPGGAESVFRMQQSVAKGV
jgi:hypothetical protein